MANGDVVADRGYRYRIVQIAQSNVSTWSVLSETLPTSTHRVG